MTNDPLITIIIPTYKRPHMLPRAIKSALNQTVQNLLIYVCDNASQDETCTLVETLRTQDRRIHLFSHATNIGMMNNYAFGLSQVRTPYFSFFSDDDLLFPSFCEITLKQFEKHPEIGFAAASTLIITPECVLRDDAIGRWPREGYFPSLEGAPELVGKYPVPNTVLFRTEHAKAIPMNHDNALFWDCEFLLRMSSLFPFCIIKEHAGIFVSHAQSCTNHVDSGQWFASMVKMEENVKKAEALPAQVQEKVLRALENEHAHVAIRSLIKHFLYQKTEPPQCYEAYLLAHLSTLPRRVKLYWNTYKLGKHLPFFSSCLHLAMKMRRPKKISKAHAQWFESYYNT